MIITLTPEIAAALNEQAHEQGFSPEALALSVLRERFVKPALREPRDEWERRLRMAASDCGVSLSNQAVSREGIYE